MTLEDIRDYVATLGISTDEHTFMGKIDANEEKCIGCYIRSKTSLPKIPIGGLAQSSYEIFPATFLIHWNSSPRETETAAAELFNNLITERNATINNKKIIYIMPQSTYPIFLNTDDNGVYEMSIDCDIYYQK